MRYCFLSVSLPPKDLTFSRTNESERSLYAVGSSTWPPKWKPKGINRAFYAQNPTVTPISERYTNIDVKLYVLKFKIFSGILWRCTFAKWKINLTMKSQHSLLKRKAVQPRTILKQRLEGNLLFTSLFSLSKSGMHNEVTLWSCVEIISWLLWLGAFADWNTNL